MADPLSFEAQFFQYALPVPFTSLYPKEFAKSNDLRLLVEIATRSYLRMYTDPKTNNLHFICKLKGPECLDIEALLTSDQTQYYFPDDCGIHRHKSNCQHEGAYFKYLQIYNLLKLKKDLIQNFMRQHSLLHESPSLILTKLSLQQEEYFFEKYINGQVELRRKLRKRFDNIVNIDIKKIGQPEEKQNTPQFTTAKKHNQPHITITPTPTPIPTPKLTKADHTTALKSSEPSKEASKATQSSTEKKSKKKKIEKKKSKAQKDRIQRRGKVGEPAPRTVEDQRESIFILPPDRDSKGEEIFIDSQAQEQLSELQVLNEHAEYQWSSSESSSRGEQSHVFGMVELNREDYFKSLRNSALKKSLQKASLTTLLFPSAPE